MSVSEVASRIAQIQGQLAMLGGPAASGSGAAFADALAGAGATTGSDGASLGAVSGRGAAGSGDGAKVVAEAKKYLGLPYVWGGTDPQRGFDCSGLVQHVYKTLGYDLPRVSYQQAAAGRPVASLAEARPGDLVAWDNSSRNNGVDHIAIYAGNGMIVEAPRTGLDIRLISLEDAGHGTPDVIRRIVPDVAASPVAGRVGGLEGTAAAGHRVAAATPYANLFNAAAAKHGVDAPLLAAIAKQESGFDASAVSHAGAQGLMQLMPATARGLGVSNSFDPAQAVDGAARLVRDLLDRFHSTPLALAAYNAGPGAVLRYDGIPPYPETQNYVKRIMATLEGAAR